MNTNLVSVYNYGGNRQLATMKIGTRKQKEFIPIVTQVQKLPPFPVHLQSIDQQGVDPIPISQNMFATEYNPPGTQAFQHNTQKESAHSAR